MSAPLRNLLAGVIALALVLVCLPLAAQRGWLGSGPRDWMEQRRSEWSFNHIYAEPAASFKTTPNDFLSSAVGTAVPGRALDVAMGEGRNAVYLASAGWKVTGFDVSEVGLAKAREHAKQAGVTIDAVHSSAESFDYGRDQWDLVVLEYAPIHYDNAAFMQRLRDSIKPGGYVLVETPVEWQDAKAKRPRVPGDLEPGELKSLFPGFEMVFYREAVGMSDWFPRETLMVRMLARKPDAPVPAAAE
jgi:2-polyprenyl-3-methyl-5-hydroxy-6-metoxy-1,4-benzoquinol methylase